MDAAVKNRCEFQLLKLMNEVAVILDLDIVIQSEAIKEGGIREVFKFFNKKKNRPYLLMSTYFLGILSAVIITVVSSELTKDTEQEDLNKEESRLRIQLLHKQLNESKSEVDSDSIQHIVQFISEDYKVRVFKSRFYATLLAEPQVYQFSAVEKHPDNRISRKELKIQRDEFNQQVLNDEDTESQIIENANIEIVSPVLKSNEMKWRAIYNGKHITFDLKDTDFKNAVLNKQYSFSNGTSIRCRLTYKIGINDLGELQNKEFTVYDVLEVYDGVESKPTARLKHLKEIANQIKLNF